MSWLGRDWVRLFGLRPEDLSRVLPLAGANGLVLASLYLLKPARNALFLQHLGIGQLPFVLLLVAVVGGVTSAVYGRLARSTRVPVLVARSFAALAIFLVAFRLLLPLSWDWLFYAFYIWVGLYGLLTTSLIWLSANGIFTAREARRVFGFVGSGGIAGAILGGLFTATATELLGTENLLLVSAGLLVAALGLIRRVQTDELVPRRSPKNQARSANLLRIPLLRSLAITTGLICAIAVLVDIQFNEIIDREYPDLDQKAAFFGHFFAYLSAGSLLFQLFATPRLMRWAGAGAVYLILPLTMGLGSLAVLLAPGLLTGILAKSGDGVFRHSVHKAASEVLFLPVPAELKKETKLFLDTTIDTLATGLAALLTFVLTSVFELPHRVLGAVAAALVVWLLLQLKPLQRAYVDAFRQALERRAIAPEELRVNPSEAAVLRALLPLLGSESERQVVYALELLASVRGRALQEAVKPLLQHPAGGVRRRALEILGNQDEPPAAQALEPLLDDPDPETRIEAMLLLIQKAERPELYCAAQLKEAALSRQIAAVGCVGRRPELFASVLEAPVLEALLNATGSEAELTALHTELARALVQRRSADAREQLDRLLKTASPAVINGALQGLRQTRNRDHLPWALERLTQANTRAAAKEALVAFGPEIVGSLARTMATTSLDLALRRQIPRVLEGIPCQESVEALLTRLHDPDLPLASRALLALVRLRQSHPELSFERDRLLGLLRDEAQHFYLRQKIHAILAADTQTGPEKLLLRALEERQRRARETVFGLLQLRHAPRDVANAYQGMIGKDAALRANALELLEHLLERKTRDLLLPCLDPGRTAAAVAEGEKLFGAANITRTEALKRLLEGRDPWLRACALFAIRSAEATPLATLVTRATRDPDPWVREAAHKLLAEA